MSKPNPFSWEHMQSLRDGRSRERLIALNKKTTRENREPLRPQRRNTRLDTDTLNFGDLI